MGCVHPVRAFRTGYKTETGADDLIRCPGSTDDLLSVISASKRKSVNLSLAPHVYINGVPFLSDPVMQPCGKCVGCRMADAREWKIRNCLEIQYEPFCYFVTLTIDDEHMPVCTRQSFMDMLQRFFKRWRKSVAPCRYFGTFEFGEHTMRPHFHLLFYTPINDLKPFGINMYVSKTLSDTWQQGQVLIEQVTPGNISYVCGYVEKKANDPNFNDYPFKPFRFASRRPAIGFRYLEDHRRRFGTDPHVYGKFSDAFGYNHSSLPQSFKRKLKDEEYFEKLKAAAELAGENALEVSKVVYGISFLPALEDAQEADLYRKLENVRNTKL